MGKLLENLPIFFIIFTVIEPLKIDIYYETLCLDSSLFITRQLYPVYNELKDHVQIKLIPYGKATHNLIDNKWKFECQHGNNECLGNKYHSCVLESSENQDKQIAFVYCAMRYRNPASLTNIKACVNRERLDWNQISSCANSSTGDQILANNGDKTPSLSFVPTIIFDNQYNAFVQDDALDDFVKVVCEKINEKKPKICTNKSR